MRISAPLHRLRSALFGSRHVRPSRRAAAAYLFALLAVVVTAGTTLRGAFGRPEPAAAMADALALFADRPFVLREALDATWSRELRWAASLPPGSADLLSPRLQPALCPAVSPAGEPQPLRDMVLMLDQALAGEAPATEPTEMMDSLRAVGWNRGGLDGALVRYNLARAHLALGDTASAARVIAAVFPNDTVRALRDRLADHSAVLAYHSRMAAAIAVYPERDSQAIGHFRGAIRMLQLIAPPAYAAEGRKSANYDFAIDPGPLACAESADLPRSMEAWVGLVGAYRRADGYTDSRENLADELEREPGEESASDPLAPLLKHGRQMAAGSSSPIPHNFLRAASNLQRIHSYNSTRPDARLDLARTVLLLDLVGKAEWSRAVAGTSPFDGCAVVGRLARDMGRSGRTMAAADSTSTDSLRAAAALMTQGRLRACGAADGAPADDVRSAWIRWGAPLLGDSVAARAEHWRLALRSPGDPAAQSRAALLQASSVERGLRFPWLPEFVPMGDTTHEFLQQWRRAVFAEVADSLGAGYDTRLRVGNADRLPDILLAVNLHAGRSPAAGYDPERLESFLRTRGTEPTWSYRTRAMAANHPVLTVLAVVAAAVAVLALSTWVHLLHWRRSLLLESRFYASEAYEE